jgi:hypothetical protein
MIREKGFWGFCFVHKYLCFRLKESSGLEDWFIDSKPDELKFIGITYIVELRENRLQPKSFFSGIEKEIFAHSIQ